MEGVKEWMLVCFSSLEVCDQLSAAGGGAGSTAFFFFYTLKIIFDSAFDVQILPNSLNSTSMQN